MKNVVLYAVDHEGLRRALYSAAQEASKRRPDPKKPDTVTVPPVSVADTVLHIAAAAQEEIARCRKAGVPSPSFKTVLEHREPNPDTGNQRGAALRSARFTEVNPATLKPFVEGDKGAEELDALFASKKGE